MDAGNTIKTSLNVVHNDEIWKDHIKRELLAQKNWSQQWGFLLDIYKEIEERPHKTEESFQSRKQQQLTDKPLSKFPETDSQMIGWKSAVGKRNPYGIPENQARGKFDILKLFNWPHEGQ